MLTIVKVIDRIPMRKTILFLFIVFFTKVGIADSLATVEYTEDNYDHEKLYAIINKKSYIVFHSKNDTVYLLSPTYSQDFDGDHIKDNLFAVKPAGSDQMPVEYKLITFNPKRGFIISNLAESWKGPIIQKINGQWQISLVSQARGKGRFFYIDRLQRYKVKDGKAVLLQEFYEKPLKAVKEVTINTVPYSQMLGEPFLLFTYDIDRDKRQDKLIGSYSGAWNVIVLDKIQFANGKKIIFSNKSELQCLRFGVLTTHILGLQDLVCDAKKRYRWNGKYYQLHPFTSLPI